MRSWVALFAVALGCAATVGAGAQGPEASAGGVIVRLRPGANAARIHRQYRVLVQDVTADGLLELVKSPPGTPDLQTATVMQFDPQVVMAEPNVPLIVAELDAQWITSFDGDRTPRAVPGPVALPAQVNYGNTAGLADGGGVTVAILDTGISLRHPALAGKVLAGWSFIDDSPNSDDAPAHLDSNGNGQPDEAAGHGTAVAGIVSRFAPGASLLPVKVMNSDGAGSVWTTIQGIRYAVAHRARVLNLSLGTPFASRVLAKEIQDAGAAGAVVIATAGNRNSRQPQYPAAFPGVLGVAALNANNTKASFSNYGSSVDLDAPGVNVVSTYWDGTYVSWSGTSFAAPMVSGEAALVLSAAPSLGAGQASGLVLATSNSVNRWNPAYVGQLGRGSAGLIDVYAGVLAAASGRRAPSLPPKDPAP